MGKAYGAWSLCYHTFGIENFMIKIALEPDKAKAMLHTLKEVPVMFGKAQIELGIDVLNLVDHCSGDLVSAETYEEFLMPIHQEIRVMIQRATRVAIRGMIQVAILAMIRETIPPVIPAATLEMTQTGIPMMTRMAIPKP